MYPTVMILIIGVRQRDERKGQAVSRPPPGKMYDTLFSHSLGCMAPVPGTELCTENHGRWN